MVRSEDGKGLWSGSLPRVPPDDGRGWPRRGSSFQGSSSALVHLRRKTLKEMEKTMLKGKAIRITGFQKATFAVKCQNP